MSLSCSLRSSSNWRLVNSDLHLNTRFEIYGSTIGVRILVCYIPLCHQFNAAIQEQIPTPNLPIKLQLGPIGNGTAATEGFRLGSNCARSPAQSDS